MNSTLISTQRPYQQSLLTQPQLGSQKSKPLKDRCEGSCSLPLLLDKTTQNWYQPDRASLMAIPLFPLYLGQMAPRNPHHSAHPPGPKASHLTSLLRTAGVLHSLQDRVPVSCDQAWLRPCWLRPKLAKLCKARQHTQCSPQPCKGDNDSSHPTGRSKVLRLRGHLLHPSLPCQCAHCAVLSLHALIIFGLPHSKKIAAGILFGLC